MTNPADECTSSSKLPFVSVLLAGNFDGFSGNAHTAADRIITVIPNQTVILVTSYSYFSRMVPEASCFLIICYDFVY